MPNDDFIDWTCPVCGASQADPADITLTECSNGHAVRLCYDVNNGAFVVKPEPEPAAAAAEDNA